ncbi:MAG TPA: hypothetical protein VIR59_11395 [Gaiellaceae bacterium]|jgi:hypothetical protein|nr:hypothetical protein [Gemmatimonadales bacterium]
MPDGKFPDKENYPHDPDGPFFDAHIAHFGVALQRALDNCAVGDRNDVSITLTADITKRNPGGIKEYKVTIGG